MILRYYAVTSDGRKPCSEHGMFEVWGLSWGRVELHWTATVLLALDRFIVKHCRLSSITKECSEMSIADSGQRRQLPSRRDVLTELKKEIIADNKFFNSLVDAIFTGTTNRSGDGCGEIDQLTTSRTGVIVQSDSGGGKTVLLETLYQIYGASSCCLLHSKSLVNKNRWDFTRCLTEFIARNQWETYQFEILIR